MDEPHDDLAHVDEDALALIDAMHLNPRASYAQLGEALDRSPTTVARHWRALTEHGDAWVSSVPGPDWRFTGALVDIDCAPQEVARVSEELSRIPSLASLHVTGGIPAMYALVITADQSLMSHTVLDLIGATRGVTAVTPLLMSEMFAWRTWSLRALDTGQRTRVTPAPSPTASTGAELSALDRALFVALQLDGRASAGQLAPSLGVAEHTVRRRLDRLIAEGVIAFRTDFVRPAGGWSIQVMLSLQVPGALVTEVGRTLATWPETRVCGSVVGDANLVVTAQLHRVQALEPLIARIEEQWPSVRVRRRRLVLRSVKSWGRILSPSGRASSVVPVDPWFHETDS